MSSSWPGCEGQGSIGKHPGGGGGIGGRAQDWQEISVWDRVGSCDEQLRFGGRQGRKTGGVREREDHWGPLRLVQKLDLYPRADWGIRVVWPEPGL